MDRDDFRPIDPQTLGHFGATCEWPLDRIAAATSAGCGISTEKYMYFYFGIAELQNNKI